MFTRLKIFAKLYFTVNESSSNNVMLELLPMVAHSRKAKKQQKNILNVPASSFLHLGSLQVFRFTPRH